MYKRILSYSISGAMGLHPFDWAVVNTKKQLAVGKITNPSALSEMQGGKVGALLVSSSPMGFKTGVSSYLTEMLDEMVEFNVGTKLLINNKTTSFAFNDNGTLVRSLISANF